ncbi:C6 finger domain [Mycena venus]|uniref:C6 finger domain n=1 Tax=Mycena venus TaxID=2733690 RepID=A0A8H6XJ65_9AGAR|nr:C6 finger domain [Mycena venus]
MQRYKVCSRFHALSYLMSRSPTPSSAFSLFTKRRRAFVACGECRKRKIKCVSVTDADSYKPCTRCALKGLKCEYYAVPDDYQYPCSQPSTPPHAQEIELHPQDHYSDPGWSSQPITPPAAGLSPYLGADSSRSKAARRSSVPIPASASTPRYPYKRRNTVAGSWSRTGHGQPSSRPHTPPIVFQQPIPRLSLTTPLQNSMFMQTPTVANPRPDFADMFSQFSSTAGTQRQATFASLPTPVAANPNPQYDSDDMFSRIPLLFGGAYDTNSNSSLQQSDQNYSQAYAEASEMPYSYSWPEPIPCICPPGPCYCGANFNTGSQ